MLELAKTNQLQLLVQMQEDANYSCLCKQGCGPHDSMEMNMQSLSLTHNINRLHATLKPRVAFAVSHETGMKQALVRPITV